MLPFFAFFPSVCFSQAQSSEKIEALARNVKLIAPEAVLKDYGDGKSATRVIVNLRKPSAFSRTPDIKDMRVRQKLVGSVNAAQDGVIGSLYPGQVQITRVRSLLQTPR